MVSSYFLLPILIILGLISFISFGTVAYKRKMSFGSIIAVMGAILIALGFAWLIAQNWHYIPSFLKIIILVGLTSLAYVIGVILREKDYPTIAKALFILGPLLYTLSIFLIAQIFSASVSIQNYAWLFLLAWIGVTFSAYFFKSYTTLIIGLVEFLVWINLQFMALIEKVSQPLALYLFLFLISGIFFYGLSLWHRTYQSRFAKLFQWWTAFYLLVFAFVLTFQSFIPMVWAKEITISTTPIIFLSLFGLLSLVIFISGIFKSLNRKIVSGKEILAVFAIVIILIGLISLTGIATNLVGTCNQKTCYDFDNQELCINNPRDLYCKWEVGKCSNNDCFDFPTQSDCDIHYNDLGCKWSNASYSKCRPIDCRLFKNQSSCEDTPPALGCTWINNQWCYYDVDYKDSCRDYDNQKKACSASIECKWQPRNNYFWRGGSAPIKLWVVWIIINIFFILFILAVIGYGFLEKFSEIINLGVIFFSLDILTRYVGFVMNFWGYTSLAIIFITGGIILIVGGWLITRWRKKLITKATEQSVSQPLPKRKLQE